MSVLDRFRLDGKRLFITGGSSRSEHRPADDLQAFALAGAAGTFGHAELGRAAAALEDALRSGPADKARLPGPAAGTAQSKTGKCSGRRPGASSIVPVRSRWASIFRRASAA